MNCFIGHFKGKRIFSISKSESLNKNLSDFEKESILFHFKKKSVEKDGVCYAKGDLSLCL